MSWDQLYFDIFHKIGQYLDGIQAAYCQRVCKRWYAMVNKDEALSFKKHIHLMVVKDRNDLERVVCKNPWKPISSTQSDMWLQSIFWYRYQLNLLDIMSGFNLSFSKYDAISIYNVILSAMDTDDAYEGDAILQDTKTKDVIFLNNFYGSFFRRCFTYEFKKCGDSILTVYNCNEYDHFVKIMKGIEHQCPGMLDWKLIHFPFAGGGQSYYVNGIKLNRGSSIMIRFKAGPLKEVFPIYKYLKKMQNAQPPYSGLTGRGNKRKAIFIDKHQTFSREAAFTHLFDKCKHDNAPIRYRGGEEYDDNNLYMCMAYDKKKGRLAPSGW